MSCVKSRQEVTLERAKQVIGDVNLDHPTMDAIARWVQRIVDNNASSLAYYMEHEEWEEYRKVRAINDFFTSLIHDLTQPDLLRAYKPN